MGNEAKKAISDKDVYNMFNDPKSDKQELTIEEFKVEKGEDAQIDKTNWKPGVMSPVKQEDDKFLIIHNIKVIPPTPKKLNEIKGQVISDYQDFLEKNWLKELKGKYKVTVNAMLLESLAK